MIHRSPILYLSPVRREKPTMCCESSPSTASALRPGSFHEEWRDIPGYEGRYQISSLGRARSLKRRVPIGYGNKRTVRERILRPGSDSFGYQIIGVRKNGASKRIRIHTIVLGVFVGPRPVGMQCRHLDGNPKNNRLDNLRWGTPSENRLDSVRHGTHPILNKKGEDSPTHKLTNGTVREMRELYKNTTITQRDLGLLFGISSRHVWDVVHRKFWAHI